MFKAIPTESVVQHRFWSKVDKTDDCWNWTATLNPKGYGTFWIKGSGMYQAHRVSYALAHGSTPPDLELDHLCRNRKCVRPSHLEPVTGLVNTGRGARATKTHCNRGHEFTVENTYRRPGGVGQRYCRKCFVENKRVWRQRQRELGNKPS